MNYSPRKLEESKAMWQKLVSEACPLGKQAIEEYTLKWGGSLGGVNVFRVEATPLGRPGEFSVRVDAGRGPDSNDWDTESYNFVVRNPNVCYGTWEDNLAYIKAAQRHCHGRPHNVDKFMTDIVMDKIRRCTGYEGLTYGDVWVHSEDSLEDAKTNGVHEGMVSFGYLSTAGQIAIDRWCELNGIKADVQGCAESTASHGRTTRPQAV